MALTYPYEYFGPVCDRLSQATSTADTISTVEILSVANIQDSILSESINDLYPNTLTINTARRFGDFGPVFDYLQVRLAAQRALTAADEGQQPSFVGQPYINPYLLADVVVDEQEDFLESANISLSDNLTNLVPSGFGPVCDIQIGSIALRDQKTDNKVAPNINLVVVEEQEEVIDKKPSPKICRTVRNVNFVSSTNFYGPVCDRQGTGGGGGVYDCPDDPETDPDLVPSTPVPLTPWSDQFPTREMKCYKLRLGQTICIDPGAPRWLSPPNNPDWPDPADEIAASGLIDGNRKKTREMNLFYRLICDDLEKKDSAGIFKKTLPAFTDLLLVELAGAGGGAGGYDGARGGNTNGGDGIRFSNDGLSLVAESGFAGSVTLILAWDDTSSDGYAVDSISVGGQTWTRSGDRGEQEKTISFSSGQTLALSFNNLNVANSSIMVSDGNRKLLLRDGAGFDANVTFKITNITYTSTGSGSGSARAINNSGGAGSLMVLQVALDPNNVNEVEMHVGGGGVPGADHNSTGKMTVASFNRGGRGGGCGTVGKSGQGGSGGGSTDFYLNGVLLASACGGGGGGGHGCLGWDPALSGKPYANWDSPAVDPVDPLQPSAALEKGRYSPLLYPPVYAVDGEMIGTGRWSDFLIQYGVWVNYEMTPEISKLFETRINLEFPVAGTYTFEVAADNLLGVYISYHDESLYSEGTYIDNGWENQLHGGDNLIGEITSGNPLYEKDVHDIVTQFLSLPSTLSASSPWPAFTKIGQTQNFGNDPPDTLTYAIPTAGRYVLKFVYGNGGEEEVDWLSDPAGFACRIKKPDTSVLWTTRSYFAQDGYTKTIATDGGGGGGGGGNEGPGGYTTSQLGLTGGSCSVADATAQGGSGGKNWVIDHPAVSLIEMKQAPAGFVSGWQAPVENKDASVRVSGGAFGGGQPTRFNIVFNGNEYPLTDSRGNFITATIPGMGNGVWKEHMNGRTFPFHYFWGKSIGDYEGANNIPNITRNDPFDPRSFELALRWTPVLSGGSWSTKVRVAGIPSWGRGTSFFAGDVLNGNMPPQKSEGTQPWIDIATDGDWGRDILTFPENGVILYGAEEGTYFSFAIKIKETTNRSPWGKGQDGFCNYLATLSENSQLANQEGLIINYYGIGEDAP